MNARITEVWFGIEDKNPTVDHGGIDHLKRNHVKLHQFDSAFHQEIEEVNKEFMKWANMKNAQKKEEEFTKPQSLLYERAAETNMSSLSEEALKLFIEVSGKEYSFGSEEMLQDLKEMGLLEYIEESNSYLPSGNAILLFGKSPRNKFPQAAVKAKVEYASGESGAQTFDDALILIPDKVDDWLKKVLPASLDRSSFKAEQVPAFPIDVVREAVINAIVHRDYTQDGAKVQLVVKPDRIVVSSPGAPQPPITIDSLKNFSATSWSRNKALTFIFNEMDFMEEANIGMDTFKSIREKYQLPLPIVDFDGVNVIVTFPRSFESVGEVSGIKSLGELNKEQLEGYEWVKVEGRTTRKEYEDHFAFSYKKAERHLKDLVEHNLIEKKGAGPGTYYEIIST